MAKQQILFIHSAGAQGKGEGSAALVASLREELGAGYTVRFPLMPDPEHPQYRRWKEQLATELAASEDGIILAGHSLGGSVLLKYLSEERCPVAVAGLFLIAVPFWGKPDWEVDEYVLRPDFADALPPIPKIVLYHSRDDEDVPLSHSGFYAEQLPQATVRTPDRGGHTFPSGLPELVDDLKKLNVRL